MLFMGSDIKGVIQTGQARIVRSFVDHRFHLAMWSLSGFAALFLIGRAVV